MMKIEDITEDDLYETMIWYISRNIVNRADSSRELAQQIAVEDTEKRQ